MRAGKLLHRVTIQSMAETQDPDTGIITNAWATFATVDAEVQSLTGREFIAAAAAQSKVTTMISIRYLPGVKASMRIIHGEHTYNIEAVLPDKKSGTEELTLPCSEVVQG